MSKTYKKPKLWLDEEDFDVVTNEHGKKKLTPAEAKKQREAEAIRMMMENGWG